MSDNGSNGYRAPLEIDVTDEHAFRSGVVQHLQFIADTVSEVPVLKQKVALQGDLVASHERIVKSAKNVSKWSLRLVTLPVLGAILKFISAKFGAHS
jgi:hypothetical protein